MQNFIGKKTILVVLLIGGLLAAGFYIRYRDYRGNVEEAEKNSVLKVVVSHPHNENQSAKLDFPGQLEGYVTASVFARVNGYLQNWTRDIGAVVRSGDVLATIDSPETDQAYEQAKSAVLSAVTSEQLAKVTYDRWQKLLETDSVSKQEVDQKFAEMKVKEAQHLIAESNLTRASKFLEYKNVVAPFSGIVTERNVDIGDLVSNGSGKRLFLITNIDTLRLYVQLPQIYLNAVYPGMPAEVQVPEYPGTNFNAKIVRTSGAVSNQTGNSLVEIQIANAAHKLTAGEFAKVTLTMKGDSAVYSLPSSALVVRSGGTFVASVDASGVVHLVPVQVSKDLGREIQVIGKIDATSNIVVNPPDTLADGLKVETQSQAAPAAHS